MSQRVLIALSLVLEPEIVIMDEPTSALDLLMQRTIVSLISDLQEKYDITIIYITHDLALVKDVADRIAVMYAFELAEVGPTRDMLMDAAHPYTRKLLNSVPAISTPVDRFSSIEGSGPNPKSVPSGCSFHPRCPLADERCSSEHPPLEEVNEGHRAACFYHEDAEEAIPMSYETITEVGSDE
jgi:oligopeptide/dipeptide ABC transporter ATP-binding protein